MNQNAEPYCPFEVPQVLPIDFDRFLIACLEVQASCDEWNLPNNRSLFLPPAS